MESEWRYLVYDTGWSISSIGLVARLVTPIGEFTHVSRAGTRAAGLYALGVADEHGYVESWFPWSTAFDVSFPWTFEVEPD